MKMTKIAVSHTGWCCVGPSRFCLRPALGMASLWLTVLACVYSGWCAINVCVRACVYCVRSCVCMFHILVKSFALMLTFWSRDVIGQIFNITRIAVHCLYTLVTWRSGGILEIRLYIPLVIHVTFCVTVMSPVSQFDGFPWRWARDWRYSLCNNCKQTTALHPVIPVYSWGFAAWDSLHG